MAFRFLAGNTHPDHDTIATFRRCFGDEIKALLALGREPHHVDLMQRYPPERFGPPPPDPVRATAHRLKTAVGRALYCSLSAPS